MHFINVKVLTRDGKITCNIHNREWFLDSQKLVRSCKLCYNNMKHPIWKDLMSTIHYTILFRFRSDSNSTCSVCQTKSCSG